MVVPDHVGFGRSDKPQPRHWYSFDRLDEAMDQHRRAALVPEVPVTLVVHDWGGVLGLPWAAQNRDLIARLVVLDTGLYLYRAGTRMSEAWWAFRNHVEGSRGHRGDQDPIIPPKVAEAMARRIPGTHRVETVRAGHFLREDAGPEIGRLIAAFVDETS